MARLIATLFVLLNLQCTGQHPKSISNESDKVSVQAEDTLAKTTITKSLQELKLKKDQGKSYTLVLREIKAQKNEFRGKNIAPDSLATVFTNALLNRVLPFWEGTEWSFEGHTAVPKKGKIACGYFVSTTLRDVGINLNRYRLAQLSPIDEAKNLALQKEVITVTENSVEKSIASINDTLKNGIHFIGFDTSHVGYLLKQNEQSYIIHSNYINSEGVIIEKIEESPVFSSYDRFYLVEISTNGRILQHWVNGTELVISN